MRNELVDKIDLTPQSVNENITDSINECFILNLDHSSNTGTHWTCVFITDKIGLTKSVKNGVCYYFDSFGFPPPIEVKDYLHKFDKRYYNSFEIQKRNQVICGHFCIYILIKLSSNIDFYETLDELYKYNYKRFHRSDLPT